jgi:hypothetical protein
LLIDNTATAHLPGPQNPGESHLYFAEGCHLYIALTHKDAEEGFWKIRVGANSTVALGVLFGEGLAHVFGYSVTESSDPAAEASPIFFGRYF